MENFLSRKSNNCQRVLKKDIQNSLVVFLDILGFKEKIKSMETDFITKEKAISVILEYLSAYDTTKIYKNKLIEPLDCYTESYLSNYEINYKVLVSQVQNELQVSYFSDSLVITLPYNNNDDDFQVRSFLLFRAVASLMSKLAETNAFVRGGIAVGKMFHKDRIFFGPALLEAVELEKIANYPRVIISVDLENKIDKKKMPYLELYDDGLYGIDCFTYIKIKKNNISQKNENINFNDELFSISELEKHIFNIIEENLDENIKKNKGVIQQKIRSKYEWLKNRGEVTK